MVIARRYFFDGYCRGDTVSDVRGEEITRPTLVPFYARYNAFAYNAITCFARCPLALLLLLVLALDRFATPLADEGIPLLRVDESVPRPRR